METFDLHILGCGSAKPTSRHMPTCQVLDARGKLYMIDCGETAQIGFARQGLKLNRLGHIFISHNHGDHIFGLPGLVSTMALLGRTADLHIHAPQQTKPLIDLVTEIYCQGIDYQILFHEIDTTKHQLIFEDRSLEVWSLPLQHRIPCSGFLFREKPTLPHIRRELIDAYGIPLSQINNIKAGASWTTDDGTVIPHERLTLPAAPPRSYAYCSDTTYLPSLAKLVENVTLLFHEATYPEARSARATETCHSTTSQAADIALKAKAGKLCIGHYSGRVKNEGEHLAEAAKVFRNTVPAKEGMVIHIGK